MSIWQFDCLYRQFPCISKNLCTALLDLSIIEHGIRHAKRPFWFRQSLNSFFFRQFDTIIIFLKCHLSQVTTKHSGSENA